MRCTIPHLYNSRPILFNPLLYPPVLPCLRCVYVCVCACLLLDQAGSSRRSARGVQIEMVPLRRERESPPSSSSSEDEEDERRVGGARGKAKLDEIYDADDERSLDSNSSSGSSDSTESYLSARSELSSESSSSSGSYTSSDESNSSLSPNDSDSDTPKMTEV